MGVKDIKTIQMNLMRNYFNKIKQTQIDYSKVKVEKNKKLKINMIENNQLKQQLLNY